MGYTRGEHARIRFAWDDAARTLTIGAREGSFPGMAETRTISVLVHDGSGTGSVFEQAPVREVTYSGEALALAL